MYSSEEKLRIRETGDRGVKMRMKTFIVNRNTPDLAENQLRQIELMSGCISDLDNEIIIYNCNEEPFQGKLAGHYNALQRYRDGRCGYYWFNHPDLSFAVDMRCLETLLEVMEGNPQIGVISPIHNGYYVNMRKKGCIWHRVACCEYLSLLIRGSVIEKIGFLNPEFKYCWGAIHEYSYKAYKNGWCVAYCDKARMHHFGGTTYGKGGTISRQEYERKAEEFERGYFLKTYGRSWDKEFAKALPEGVINTFSIDRGLWDCHAKARSKNMFLRKFLKRIGKYLKIDGTYMSLIRNRIRLIKIKKRREAIKLHLGCGEEKREGWINIDINKKVDPDLAADVKNLGMFTDGSVDEIECCHLFEHLTYPEAVKAMKEWHRILKQGGRLYLELPNLERCVEILYRKEGPDAERLSMIGLYGYPPDILKGGMHMVHKYSWTPEALSSELKKIGFSAVKEASVTQTWREATKYNRDMRLECIK